MTKVISLSLTSSSPGPFPLASDGREKALYKIQHKSITSFAEGVVLELETGMQCLSEKN